MFSLPSRVYIALIFAVCVASVAFADDSPPKVAVGQVVDDLTLTDCDGIPTQLSQFSDSDAIVIMFFGVDCPLAKLYGQRVCQLAKSNPEVAFVGVDSNHRDDVDSIRAWQHEFASKLPVFSDRSQAIADALGATRNPQVVVLDRERRIRYRGRIDDQYTTLRRSNGILREDLAIAIDELLHGKDISDPEPVASGCFIDRNPIPEAVGDKTITYYQHVAPILQRRCVSCHREGQSAPFALTNYEEASSWIDTIDEVVRERRMPPWYASPDYGDFANFAGLTPSEQYQIHRWVEAAGPAGDPANATPLPPLSKQEWQIGEPDFVITIPEPFTIPAEGVLEYQYVLVDPKFTEDKWIQAAEVKPSNPAVVHHCNVWPQEGDSPRVDDVWGSAYLAVTAPGRPPMSFPEGMAKRIPAGAKLVFQLHYQSIGSEQVDRTSLGLKFADPASVRREVATRGLVACESLQIPPGDPEYRVELTETLEDDLLLLAMSPHMHLRGKSCRYEALYPNGYKEILLDIPSWNFNWQDRYVLEEHKRLPAGTKIIASAVFDNSTANPFNPDATAKVVYGPQSTDEMFNAWYEAVLENVDVTTLAANRQAKMSPLHWAFLIVGGCATWCCGQRLKRRISTSAQSSA